MKAFTACVLISIITLSAAAGKCYHTVNVTRGGNITLTGAGINTTWTAYHNDGKGQNGWLHICTWGDPIYVCHGNSSTISNLTVVAHKNLTDRTIKAYSYENKDDYETVNTCFYVVKVIELPTTRAPTTVRTTRETTQPTTVPTTHPTTVSTTIETTTQLDTTVQNTTLLIGFLLRGNESTTDQTEATSSAFSSTANLTSLASVNETVIALKLDQDRGLDMQITFLIVCGIFILAVLLYYVFCKARKSHRTIYRPVIGEPQPLQVDGGLRNLLFSFTVW